MKRLAIVSVLVLGIIAISAYARHTVNDTRQTLHDFYGEIYSGIKSQDINNIEHGVQQLVEYWTQQQRHLLRFFRHAEIDEISHSVSRLKAYTADKKDHSELEAEIRAIVRQIDHIWESDRVRMGLFAVHS